MSEESRAPSPEEAEGNARQPIAIPRSFSPGQRLLFRSYVVAAFALFALFFGLYAFAPSLRDLLVQEDQAIENVTTGLFLSAVLVACLTIRRRGLASLPRGYALVGFVALVATLEELSYGQRLFPDLRFPELSDGATFDALHDINHVIFPILERAGTPWKIALASIGLLSLVSLRKPLARLLRANLRPDRIWLYMSIGAGGMLVSIAIDTLPGPSRLLVLLEELAEMIVATSVLFAALAGLVVNRSDREAARAASRPRPVKRP